MSLSDFNSPSARWGLGLPNSICGPHAIGPQLHQRPQKTSKKRSVSFIQKQKKCWNVRKGWSWISHEDSEAFIISLNNPNIIYNNCTWKKTGRCRDRLVPQNSSFLRPLIQQHVISIWLGARTAPCLKSTSSMMTWESKAWKFGWIHMGGSINGEEPHKKSIEKWVFSHHPFWGAPHWWKPPGKNPDNSVGRISAF